MIENTSITTVSILFRLTHLLTFKIIQTKCCHDYHFIDKQCIDEQVIIEFRKMLKLLQIEICSQDLNPNILAPKYKLFNNSC